jgi:hypothetical protein
MLDFSLKSSFAVVGKMNKKSSELNEILLTVRCNMDTALGGAAHSA